MIKMILSMAIVAIIFSGCVGTIVATNNVKNSKATTVYAKSNNDVNRTKTEAQKTP